MLEPYSFTSLVHFRDKRNGKDWSTDFYEIVELPNKYSAVITDEEDMSEALEKLCGNVKLSSRTYNHFALTRRAFLIQDSEVMLLPDEYSDGDFDWSDDNEDDDEEPDKKDGTDEPKDKRDRNEKSEHDDNDDEDDGRILAWLSDGWEVDRGERISLF